MKKFFKKRQKSKPDDVSTSPAHPDGEQTRTSTLERASALLVGAIDFGTTNSGWACSFVHDYMFEPTKSRVKHWQSGSSLVTEKAPTCALIRPDRETLEAFGYEAENRYMDLVQNGQQEEYYYFKRFKMALNRKLGEGIEREFTIEDEMHRSLPAMTVFSKVIEYLTTDMVTTVNNGLDGTVSIDDVVWVLTVPAIWTDSAKCFMREAAKAAGIKHEKILICLEPEAASIYCRHLSVQKDRDNISSYPPGTKYLVLDAGGGTIDVTVHEVTSSGGLKEIHSASGGGWGGTLVDNAFKEFITDLITPSVYDNFVTSETEDWLEFWREFEVKKKTVSPSADSTFMVKIPFSLANLCEKSTSHSLKETVASSKYSEQIKNVNDKMKIEASLMKALFETSVTKTVDHVKTLLRDPKVEGIKAILMVGGFSDSRMLQEAVKASFPELSVIQPPESASCILKGAVIFGHSPKSITERVLKYTYGVESTEEFIPGFHPPDRREVADSGVLCRGIFDKHAEINQIVPVDKACDGQWYTPAYRWQRDIHIDIYASELSDPMYVDQDCTKIGEMIVNIPKHRGDMKNGVYLSMKFGGTELEVTGLDAVTGKATAVAIDFLE